MKTLIVSGGKIDRDFSCSYIKEREFDLIIAADGGLAFLDEINLVPHMLIGDFDTIDKRILDRYLSMKDMKVRRFIPEKDYTDTHIAVTEAVDLGSSEIHILGGTGSRIDHMLSNIHILLIPLKKGIPCYLVDKNNRISLLKKTAVLKKREVFGDFLSLIPFTESVEDVNLTGMKYPLNHARFVLGESLGISNEVIEEEAVIDFKTGILIMLETRD